MLCKTDVLKYSFFQGVSFLMRLLALKPRAQKLKIMHVLHKLILSTSKITEGAKQDVHCWKKTFIFSDYSSTIRELSLI